MEQPSELRDAFFRPPGMYFNRSVGAVTHRTHQTKAARLGAGPPAEPHSLNAPPDLVRCVRHAAGLVARRAARGAVASGAGAAAG